jgi:hypothetical protein
MLLKEKVACLIQSLLVSCTLKPTLNVQSVPAQALP